MLVRLSDDAEHYIDPDGDRYVRVSRVLSGSGLLRTFYSHSTFYRDRGRAVHLACELVNKAILRNANVDIDAILDPASLDPRIAPYVQSYFKFLREVVFLPIAIELSLGSIHGFAGTIDIVCLLNGELSIIDIKTGETIDPSVDYQTAAYEVLWNENNPTELIKKRFALQLKSNALYKLHKLGNVKPTDFLNKWDEFQLKVA